MNDVTRALGRTKDARIYAEKRLFEVEYQVEREQRELDEMKQNQLPGRGERDLLVRKARAEKQELKTKVATKRREVFTEAEEHMLERMDAEEHLHTSPLQELTTNEKALENKDGKYERVLKAAELRRQAKARAMKKAAATKLLDDEFKVKNAARDKLNAEKKVLQDAERAEMMKGKLGFDPMEVADQLQKQMQSLATASRKRDVRLRQEALEKAEVRRVQAERRVDMTVEEIKEEKAKAKAEKVKKKGASDKGVGIEK